MEETEAMQRYEASFKIWSLLNQAVDNVNWGNYKVAIDKTREALEKLEKFEEAISVTN